MSCNKGNRNKKSYPDKKEAKLLYTHVLENMFFIETFITCLILIVFSLFPGKNDKAMHTFSPKSDWVVQDKMVLHTIFFCLQRLVLDYLQHITLPIVNTVQLAIIDYEMVVAI